MSEINDFIASKHSEGYSNAEIARMIEGIFDQSFTTNAIYQRIKKMKARGELSDFSETKGSIDILEEIDREMGGLFKIGVLDVETTGLWADFGYVLVAIIKDIETNKYEVFRLDETPSYRNIKNRQSPQFWRRIDYEILKRIREQYEQYDIIVHFNGRNFDIKFLNTRLVKNGLPVLPEMKQLDIYQIARSKLRLRSKRLSALKEFLEIDEEESGHKWEYWQMAANGIGVGFDFVVEHCKKDVDRLAQITRRMKAYINYIRK